MAVIESEVQDAQESGKMRTGAAIEVERFLMNDMDHRVIGGRLAESWGIDTELQQVITHHHDVGDKAPGLLKLIRRHGGQLPLPLSCRGHSAPLPPVLHAHRQSGEEVHQAWRRRSGAGHPKRSSRTSLRSSAGFSPLLICRSWWTYELLQTRLYDRIAETATIGFLQLTG